jgi:FG-GAP-like repeat
LAVTIGPTPSAVSIFLGNGDLTFQSPKDFTTGDSPVALAVNDFNKDGKLDLAVANQTSNTVSIFLGNGDGTFQPRLDFATGRGPVSLASSDFNADGSIDIIVANATDQTTSLLLGRGDGTFQNPITYPLGLSPSSIVAGDFNGDLKTDLVVAGTSNALFALVVLIGNGDGTFQAQPQVPVNSLLASVCPGDFNGDGVLDIVAANPNNDSVTVLINQGPGSFRSFVEYATSSDPRSVIEGDFNGDGVLDLVTSNWLGDNVSILLGNGDGTFRAHADYQVAGPPSGVTAADFNLDGRLDLVVANNVSSGTISVLLGIGDGTFLPRIDEPAGVQLQHVASGDFNGDGKPDLVLTNGGPTPFLIPILLGNGDGTFRSGNSYPTGLSPYATIVGDFNGDAKLDVAVANTSSATVSIFLGNGDGTFRDQIVSSTGDVPYSLVAGDFNRDGKLDLATANLGANTVSVLLGNGDGTFQNHVDYATGKFTLAVTTGDLNGDGNLDLAVSSLDDNTVSVLLGNGDGTFRPRIGYATGNGPEGGITGDFNRDGGLDLAVTARFDNAASIFLNAPVISLYPNRITFTHQPVTTSSAIQTVLISNPGSMPLKVHSVTANGDFTQVNNCGNSVAVASNCQINLVFSPAVMGVRNGSLIITDDLASSPQVIPLTGVGIGPGPVANLSPKRLMFASPAVGSIATAQTVILTNTGNTALSLSNIRIDGLNKADFSEISNCGNIIPAQANCAISVGFLPTTASELATLTITDNADDSPQQLALVGTVSDAAANISPSRIIFPSQPVGTTSPPHPVTIAVSGTGNFPIQSISATGDFAETNNCFTRLPATNACVVNVTFTPLVSGDRAGNLVVQRSGTKTVVGLAGLGGDFAINVPLPSVNVTAGQTKSYDSPSLVPVAGFDKIVNLTCTGAPAGASCLLPPSINLSNGLYPIGFTVTVNTTARASVPSPIRLHIPDSPPSIIVLVIFAILLGFYALQRKRKGRLYRYSVAVVGAPVLFLVVILGGCGAGGSQIPGLGTIGGANSSTPPGTYTLTVTGTYASGSTSLTHSINLTLSVH